MKTIQKKPKTKQQLAKTAMRQLADEPLEILRTAKQQVGVAETRDPSPQENISKETPEPSVNAEQIKAQSQRRLQALENEIEEIRKGKKQKEEEKRQQEDIERQQLAQEQAQSSLPEPTSKRKKGMQAKLGKLKRKSEIRMPPSG